MLTYESTTSFFYYHHLLEFLYILILSSWLPVSLLCLCPQSSTVPSFNFLCVLLNGRPLCHVYRSLGMYIDIGNDTVVDFCRWLLLCVIPSVDAFLVSQCFFNFVWTGTILNSRIIINLVPLKCASTICFASGGCPLQLCILCIISVVLF